MEEDIELVEEFINICEINFKFYEQPNVVIISDTVEAIKNLIKRNKELEKLELEHQRINGNLREKIKELEHKYQRALSDLLIAENTKHTCLYIPTSGVTCDVKELEESISKEYKLGFAQAEYETNEDWKFKITEKIDELKDKLWRLQIQFNELKNYAQKEEFLSEQLKIWGAIQILEEILGGKQ